MHILSYKNKLKSGFTLIEIMMSIVILSIIISLVTLASKPNSSRQLKQDAQYLGDMLDAVQQEAGRLRKNITVSINNNGIYTDLKSNNNLLNKYNWNIDNIQVKYGWREANNSNNAWQRAITQEAIQTPFYLILIKDNYSVILYGDGSGNYQTKELKLSQ